MAEVKVTFENTAFADAIGKAARVAPTKGAAFDKAAGIHVQVQPDGRTACMRATNLEVTFEQFIDVADSKGAIGGKAWRIPATLISGIASSLSMAEGKTIDFIDREDSWLRIKADKWVTRMALLPVEEYPLRAFLQFDKDTLFSASEMSQKVEQVAWAVDPGKPNLAGVYVDGARLVACNAYSLAVVPCSVTIDTPVIVPLKTLATLLRQASDVRVGATEKRFLMSLDAETRATATLIDGTYPNIDGLRRDNYTGTVSFHRMNFLETLQRMLNLARHDKLPTLKLRVDGTKFIKDITFDIEVEGVGRMQDSVDVNGEYADVFDVSFIPNYLLDAVNSSRAERMEFAFGHPTAPLAQVRLRDDQGYECTLMPKRGD